MPVYRIDKTKLRVVVFRKGKRHDWVVHGTREEAETFEAEQRLKLEAQDPLVDLRAVPTISDFCVTKYIQHAAEILKDRTLSNRMYQVATLQRYLGHIRLDALTRKDVEGFRTARRRERHETLDEETGAVQVGELKGIRPGTVNDDLKVLRAIFSFARELGYKAAFPKVKDLPVVERRHAEPWTVAEIVALYAELEKDEAGRSVLPIAVFLANTGARKGEAIALEWRSVDVPRRTIWIEPNEDWQPKDGEARAVPISDALLPWLKQEHPRYVFPCWESQRVRGEGGRFEGRYERVRGPDGYYRGGRYAYFPQRIFERAVRAAGLEGGPHKLRHTYASHYLAAKPDMFSLGRILGQTTARVTELYSHLLPGALAEAAKVVSIGPASGPAVLEAKKRWGIE